MSRQYLNAPLREAVCEFRFQSESPWDLAIPGLVYAALKHQYPNRVPAQSDLIARVTVGAGGAQPEVQPIEVQNELRFWRDSDDGVIRVRQNSLSVSHYKAYTSWEKFRPVVLSVLKTYCEIAHPIGIERIGLRYINEFDFDEASDGSNGVDLDQFFDLGPKVGDRLRQDLGSFLVGIQYLFESGRDSLRIQMQPVPMDRTGVAKITLDLDYFLNQPGQVVLEAAEEWMDAAHNRIGEAFEGCITDRLRERLKPVGG